MAYTPNIGHSCELKKLSWEGLQGAFVTSPSLADPAMLYQGNLYLKNIGSKLVRVDWQTGAPSYLEPQECLNKDLGYNESFPSIVSLNNGI